jgi:hypothetical protein
MNDEVIGYIRYPEICESDLMIRDCTSLKVAKLMLAEIERRIRDRERLKRKWEEESLRDNLSIAIALS